MSSFLLPLMAMGMFGNNGFENYHFFGCINDYERYKKVYSKYGGDK